MYEELQRLLDGGLPADQAVLVGKLARRLFARVPARSEGHFSAPACAEIARAAFDFILVRSEAVKLGFSRWERDGRACSVVQTLTADRSFVVDTIQECLREFKLPVRSLLHPILRVGRDFEGHLKSLEQGGADERPESFVRAELDCELDARVAQDVADELKARLEDLVRVTDDFEPMAQRALRIGDEIIAEHALNEARDFMRWLVHGGLVFLGYRRYRISSAGGQRMVALEPGSGLGILRAEARSRFAQPRALETLGPDTLKALLEEPVPFVTKTRAKSSVHRRRAMDDITVRRVNAQGEAIAFDRFLGLFTSKAYSEEPQQIPIVGQKLAEVLAEEKAVPGSHDFKTLLALLNTFPKEELFRASVEELRGQLSLIADFPNENAVEMVSYADRARRMTVMLVVMGSKRYSADLYEKIRDTLSFRVKAPPIYDHLVAASEDYTVRLHFCFPMPREAPDYAALRAEVADLARTWEERLRDELAARHGQARGRELAERYSRAFSADYCAATTVARAAEDVERIEALLARRDLDVEVVPACQGREYLSELRVCEVGQPVALADLLPRLQNFGVRVLYENVHEVRLAGCDPIFMQVFAVQTGDGRPLSATAGVALLAAALAALKQGLTEDDALNALTLQAGLSWREVAVLRAYLAVALQMKLGPTLESLRRVLLGHSELARLLIELFKARLNPDTDASPDRLAHLRSSYHKAREQIDNFADDLLARNLLALVEATVRTNYFREPAETHISLKFESQRIANLPDVAPMYELHVMSPTMAGCHLRAGPIARGGIRFSERLDDYRVEILGLMKTQTVKNAIIVPIGAKGGFVVKSAGARRPAQHQAVEAYQTLIGAMLDLTSNVVEGRVVAPERVKVLDDDGPYLVVAADKGTATFSDLANRLARERGFWLDDAFASGGEHGYDHKQLGITARGAWESVRRHFRELGRDPERGAPITVVGIGDMSGDVFGNGLLQSANVKLIAAFDARYIFIDPDPDPAQSYRERRRLFALANSKWADYDVRLLSPGGGVFLRSQKEIVLSPQAKTALGIEADAIDGEALVRAVLRAPVDLLYNGGVGTYVRASDESDAEVADHGNDGCRISARELRAKVVVEGGNLGFTHKARVEYALNHGKINTDAIDNSAGVDMSDHEVNLKILMAPLVKKGELSLEERNALLRDATAEVVEQVLEDNRQQVLLLSLEEARSRVHPMRYGDLIAELERRGVLRREIEGLPSREEIEQRRPSQVGLTRPELAVLTAYTKLDLIRQLEESRALDWEDPYLVQRFLMPYFPRAIAARFAAEIPKHQLRLQLATTRAVNEMVGFMGALFAFDLSRGYGAAQTEVVRVWVIASEILNLNTRVTELRSRAGEVSVEAELKALLTLADSCVRACRWILLSSTQGASPSSFISQFAQPVARLVELFDGYLTGSERARFEGAYRELKRAGHRERIALDLARLGFVEHLLAVAALALECQLDLGQAAAVYFGLVDEVDFGMLEGALQALDTDDLWERHAARELGADLKRARYELARTVLAGTTGMDWAARLREILRQPARGFLRTRELLERLRHLPTIGLAPLEVATRAVDKLCAAQPEVGGVAVLASTSAAKRS
jgi:glutamate dehydrogenase